MSHDRSSNSLTVVLSTGGPKTWPAGARVEFGVGGEQRCATAEAAIHAACLLVPIRAAEGALGAVLLGHTVLLGRELPLPLGFGLDDFRTGIGGGVHLKLR